MSIEDLSKRIDTLEKIFGKIMEINLRLDTLEFNSDHPVRPAIGEKLLTLHMRIEKLEQLLLPKENDHDRNDNSTN